MKTKFEYNGVIYETELGKQTRKESLGFKHKASVTQDPTDEIWPVLWVDIFGWMLLIGGFIFGAIALAVFILDAVRGTHFLKYY